MEDGRDGLLAVGGVVGRGLLEGVPDVEDGGVRAGVGRGHVLGDDGVDEFVFLGRGRVVRAEVVEDLCDFAVVGDGVDVAAFDWCRFGGLGGGGRAAGGGGE